MVGVEVGVFTSSSISANGWCFARHDRSQLGARPGRALEEGHELLLP